MVIFIKEQEAMFVMILGLLIHYYTIIIVKTFFYSFAKYKIMSLKYKNKIVLNCVKFIIELIMLIITTILFLTLNGIEMEWDDNFILLVKILGGLIVSSFVMELFFIEATGNSSILDILHHTATLILFLIYSGFDDIIFKSNKIAHFYLIYGVIQSHFVGWGTFKHFGITLHRFSFKERSILCINFMKFVFIEEILHKLVEQFIVLLLFMRSFYILTFKHFIILVMINIPLCIAQFLVPIKIYNIYIKVKIKGSVSKFL